MLSPQSVPISFPALGTTIAGAIITDQSQGQALWTDVRQRIDRFSNRFSRFLPASELSQLNSRPGAWVTVSEEMLGMLQAAQTAWEQTNHLVDPTIGYALITAGYDRSFEKLAPQERRPLTTAKMVRATLDMIRVEPERQRVQVPIGVSLDFGGIGKGLLLDQLAPVLDQVATRYWLSLGGDIIVSGTGPDNQPWPIGIQDPQYPERDWAKLVIPAKRTAVATSGTLKRQGVRNGQPWHHLIDPRTGRPSTTEVVSATVIAPDGVTADVFAKAVLLQGAVEGIAWAEAQPGIEALVVCQDGQSRQTSGLQQFIQMP